MNRSINTAQQPNALLMPNIHWILEISIPLSAFSKTLDVMSVQTSLMSWTPWKMQWQLSSSFKIILGEKMMTFPVLSTCIQLIYSSFKVKCRNSLWIRTLLSSCHRLRIQWLSLNLIFGHKFACLNKLTINSFYDKCLQVSSGGYNPFWKKQDIHL